MGIEQSIPTEVVGKSDQSQLTVTLLGAIKEPLY